MNPNVYRAALAVHQAAEENRVHYLTDIGQISTATVGPIVLAVNRFLDVCRSEPIDQVGDADGPRGDMRVAVAVYDATGKLFYQNAFMTLPGVSPELTLARASDADLMEEMLRRREQERAWVASGSGEAS